MAKTKPLKLSADPIGTVDELKILNLPAKVVPTCSAFEDGRNAGCQYFEVCEREDKGEARWRREPGTNGPDDPGERNRNFGNLGIYVADAITGNAVEDVVPCYHLMAHIHRMRDEGSTVEVIAEEGEWVRSKGTVIQNNGVNSKGQAREVARSVEFNRRVKAHPTMAENEVVAKFLRSRRVTEALKETRRTRRLGEVVQRDRQHPKKVRQALAERLNKRRQHRIGGEIDEVAEVLGPDGEPIDETFDLSFREPDGDPVAAPGSAHPMTELDDDDDDQRVRPRNGAAQRGSPGSPAAAPKTPGRNGKVPKRRAARAARRKAPSPAAVKEVKS